MALSYLSHTCGVELCQHLGVVMDLIFLGMVKMVVQLVSSWTKWQGKNASFLIYDVGTLDAVQVIGLDWCKVMPYSVGSLGGQISKKYMAIVRLAKWFYSMLDSIVIVPVYEPPDWPSHLWTAANNRG